MESTLLAGGKSKKNNGNLGGSARGQAYPGSAAVYTMDRPGPVICMYVCVGTVSHPHGPTDPLVVALLHTCKFIILVYFLLKKNTPQYLCSNTVRVSKIRLLKFTFLQAGGRLTLRFQ